MVLIATGRIPNTNNIGLEDLGVKLSQKGQVLVNDKFQTNISTKATLINTLRNTYKNLVVYSGRELDPEPEPEIPEAIAPLIFEIFIKLSNSGIKIRLFGSAIKSTIDLDIRSKSSVYKLLTNDPRLADCLTIFSISIL